MPVNKNYRGRISELVPYTAIGIDKGTYIKKNKDKSWEYGEYPEFDINFICISKDGTLGEIRKVGDLIIGLPSIKDVVNDGVLGSKWERIKYQEDEDFNKIWVEYKRDMAENKIGSKRELAKKKFLEKRQVLYEKHQEFINRMYHIREFGQFITVDSEVIYITGENWMFLQHYFLTESDMYPMFRVVQVEAFWHWEAVKADSRVWAEIRGKGRRTSWSVESGSMGLNMLTIITQARIPIVSESSGLAKDFFKDKISSSFKYYPVYFKPFIDLPNVEDIGSLNLKSETEYNAISSIKYYPTKVTAYDGTAVKFLSINDEIGKWIKQSLILFISRHSKCHTENGATGRFGSTAGDYHKGGGQEFETEFLNANATDRNELGRTTNGMVSLFIDTCYTMTEPTNYFDEWGYSVVYDPEKPIKNQKGKLISNGAITEWQITYDTLEKKKQGKKLTAFLRDSPRTIDHMFRSEGGKNNNFSIANLNSHLDHLNRIPKDVLNGIVFVGRLRFKGEKFKSDVEWVPDPNGNIKTTWIPPKELQNNYSKRRVRGKDLLMPDNNDIGCFGIDSYDIVGEVDRGSDGAIVGYSNFNMAGAPSNSFFLTYLDRPERRDDFYDDAIKICMFYGMYALIENNKPRLLEYMYDNGVTGFSMRRPDAKYKDLKPHEKLWGGIPSSSLVIEACTNALQDYILSYVGLNLDEECTVYFPELIKEWIRFKPSKRKEFDLGVASGLAKLGSRYKPRTNVKTLAFNQGEGLSMYDFSA